MVIKSHPVVTSCMLIVENHNLGGHIEIVQLLRENRFYTAVINQKEQLWVSTTIQVDPRQMSENNH